MNIVPITEEYPEDVDHDYFYSISDLIDLLYEYESSTVYFYGTKLSPCYILSWRGCYNLPAILAAENSKTAFEIANDLEKGLELVHEGWKGGEYEFTGNEEFRVVMEHRSSAEHGVFGYSYNSGTNILELKTAINSF